MKTIELTKDFFEKPEIEQKILLQAIKAHLNGKPSKPPVTGMKKRTIQQFIEETK